MKIFTKTSDIQKYTRNLKNKSLGIVPTMGALHEGHISLIKRSQIENQATLVTIFVNPTQFNSKEDLAKYPRALDKDKTLLRRLNVDILFAPTSNSMYPSGYGTSVSISGLTEVLEGAATSRGPSHFIGVATVVTKLFNLTSPQKAYFGEKDFQQLRVIEKMVLDLNMTTDIVRCPTLRAKDGLALSSRNSRLSKAERVVAPTLYRSLQFGGKLLRSGRASIKSISKMMKSTLNAVPNSRLDYLDFIDPKTLKPVKNRKKPILIAAAWKLGSVRLIDNLLVK